jgi:hypothetical protein
MDARFPGLKRRLRHALQSLAHAELTLAHAELTAARDAT